MNPLTRDPLALCLSIYGQDGKLITFPVADTQGNRSLVAWLKAHDRYTVGGEHSTPNRKDV